MRALRGQPGVEFPQHRFADIAIDAIPGADRRQSLAHLGQGHDDGAIAHVVLDLGAGSSIKLDVTVLQTATGWYASDTSCTGQDAQATSIYAAAPSPCG